MEGIDIFYPLMSAVRVGHKAYNTLVWLSPSEFMKNQKG